MTSLPSPSYLAARRGHSHRRSAAISGDFDVQGLGLFQQPPTPSSIKMSPRTSVSSLKDATNLLKPAVSDYDENLDKYFKFNNDDDFSNRVEGSYAFPSTKDENTKPVTPKDQCLPTLPAFKFGGGGSNLSSPIKLASPRASRKSGSFFITDETNVNKDNVPEALIDLDEILNFNLNPTAVPKKAFSHRRTESAPELENFFGSPYSPPFSYQSTNKKQLTQGNEELILEEEEEEEEEEDFQSNLDKLKLYSQSNNSSNISFITTQNAHSLTNNLIPSFSHSSVQSLNSSHSSNSNLHQLATPVQTPNQPSHPSSVVRKSQAQATRYQSFYDNSFKISSALKSSDSVNIVPSSSNNSNSSNNNSINNLKKSLGHSSSLPILQNQQPVQQKHKGMGPPAFVPSKLKSNTSLHSPKSSFSPAPATVSLSSSLPNTTAVFVNGKTLAYSPTSLNSQLSVTDEKSSITTVDTGKSIRVTSPVSGDQKKKFTPPAIVISDDTNKILKLTAIPKHSPRKKGHFKSRSLIDIDLKSFKSSDNSSIKSDKKGRFLSWIRRKQS